jgi:Tol biopolymer transport system component
LYLAPLNGGEKKFVAGPLQGKYPVFGGHLSPDSRKLVLSYRVEGHNPLYVVPLSTDYKPQGEPKPLTPLEWNTASPAWTPDGREIVFIRSAGDANAGSDSAMYRVAVSGGVPRRLDFAGDNPWFLAVAPRGNRMAFTRLRRDINIYRLELEADGMIRRPGQMIASSSRRDEGPAWSPDGKRIAFASNRAGSLEIWTAQADGGNAVQLTTSHGATGSTGPQWSPDGSTIAYSDSRILVIPASGGVARALTADGNNVSPTWSRDGKWVYFKRQGPDLVTASNIWKVPSSGGEARQVTRTGGDFALESPDGKWLYFASEGVLRRMPVEGGETVDMARDLTSSGGLRVYRFFVTGKGVYYLARGPLIRFISHAGGEPKTIGSIPRNPSTGLSLSPDGRHLLYSQYDQSAAELLLVENFH